MFLHSVKGVFVDNCFVALCVVYSIVNGSEYSHITT
jgi:hypothetical protein